MRRAVDEDRVSADFAWDEYGGSSRRRWIADVVDCYEPDVSVNRGNDRKSTNKHYSTMMTSLGMSEPNSADGAKPNIPRNALLMCAASEKPAA